MALDKKPRLALSAGYGLNSRTTGKTDSGALIKGTKITEAAFVRDITKRMYKNFSVLFSGRRKGYVMFIDDVKYFKADDLAKRRSCDLFIEYHLNAGGGTGTGVLYEDTKDKVFAVAFSKAIAKAIGVRNRGAKRITNLAVLDPNAGMVQVLAELFFADNTKDYAKFSNKHLNIELVMVNQILAHYGWKPVTSLPRTWNKIQKWQYKGY